MESKDALKSLELKFTSSNKISVERAVITRKEWEAIYNLVVPALRAVWADSNELGTGWQRPSTHRLLKKAIEAIGAEPTTAEPQKHASDERRGG